MKYTAFKDRVVSITGAANCRLYNYILPIIPDFFHERYIYTLNKGFNMPDALRHLYTASRLPEKNYNRYINYFYLQRSIAESFANYKDC